MNRSRQFQIFVKTAGCVVAAALILSVVANGAVYLIWNAFGGTLSPAELSFETLFFSVTAIIAGLVFPLFGLRKEMEPLADNVPLSFAKFVFPSTVLWVGSGIVMAGLFYGVAVFILNVDPSLRILIVIMNLCVGILPVPMIAQEVQLYYMLTSK